METKACRRCGLTKPLNEFYHSRHGKDRHQSWCKDCQKAAITTGYRNNPEKHAAYNREWDRHNPDRKADIQLKTRLGLPHGTYAAMLASQDGKCGICRTDKPGRRIARFHVDHDDVTGQIRGLLCENCNMGIGHLAHSIERLSRAMEYLLEYPSSAEGPSIA